MVPKPCKFCGKEFTPRPDHIRRGYGFYCSRDCHYNFERTRVVELDVEAFWSRADKSIKEWNGSACWIWTGNISCGYGRFIFHGRQYQAHRIAYVLRHGSVPVGMTLDHLCRNRACINPDHLEPVTIAENVIRGESPPARNKTRTQCVNGHDLSGANVYYCGPNKKWRGCAICRKRRNDISNANRVWRSKLYA